MRFAVGGKIYCYGYFTPPREVRTTLAGAGACDWPSAADEHTRGVRPAGLVVVVDGCWDLAIMLVDVQVLRAFHLAVLKLHDAARRRYFLAKGVGSNPMAAQVRFVDAAAGGGADRPRLDVVLSRLGSSRAL